MPWEKHRAPRVQRTGRVPKMLGAEERGMGSMRDLGSVGKEMGELKVEGEERMTQEEEVGETVG